MLDLLSQSILLIFVYLNKFYSSFFVLIFCYIFSGRYDRAIHKMKQHNVLIGPIPVLQSFCNHTEILSIIDSINNGRLSFVELMRQKTSKRNFHTLCVVIVVVNVIRIRICCCDGNHLIESSN